MQTHLSEEAVAASGIRYLESDLSILNLTLQPAPCNLHPKAIAFVGDRVRILDSGLHHEKDGKVLAVSFGSSENDYQIALDKELHLSREVTVRVPRSQKFPILMKL